MIEILDSHTFQEYLRETASPTIQIKFLNKISVKTIPDVILLVL